jgi:hypothetical protein
MVEAWAFNFNRIKRNSDELIDAYTVAKTIGNRSDRWKITLFITDISATYNFILS